MNENKNENGNSDNTEVEEVVAPAADAPQEEKDAYYEALESSNKQLFARAKKAEGFVFTDGKWVKPTKKEDNAVTTTTSKKEDGLSQADLITVIKANIDEEDLPEVLDYAKMKGITVAEALKSPMMKTILATKVEERKTAEGANTSGGRRGSSSSSSDEAILANAAKGILPESDQDMARLVELRRNKGRNKK